MAVIAVWDGGRLPPGEACTVPSGMELVLREGAFRSVPAQGFLGPSSVGTHFPFLGATKGDSNRLGVWGSLGQPRPATQKSFSSLVLGFSVLGSSREHQISSLE